MRIVAIARRELIVATILIGIGLLPLPLVVYWVGQQIVGEYPSQAGIVGLLGQVWTDFFALQPAALALVLSPYLFVMLLRAAIGTMRHRRDVTQVSNSPQSDK